MSGATFPDKPFATLQARPARQGVSLHRIQDDYGQEMFVGAKWAMTRQMRSLQEVEPWLQRISGKVVPLAVGR